MPSNEVLRKTIEIFERYELFGSDTVRSFTCKDDTNRLERVEFVETLNGIVLSTSIICTIYFSPSENDKGGRIVFVSKKYKNKLIDLLPSMSEEDRSVIVNETFPRSNLLQLVAKKVLS